MLSHGNTPQLPRVLEAIGLIEVHRMKRIHPVAAAVVVAIALAACRADPIGPASQSGRLSLFTVGATEAPPVHATDAVGSDCAPAVGIGDEIVSGSSTYAVAYDELPRSCATPPTDISSVAPPPADTSSVTLPPATDVVSSRL